MKVLQDCTVAHTDIMPLWAQSVLIPWYKLEGILQADQVLYQLISAYLSGLAVLSRVQ